MFKKNLLNLFLIVSVCSFPIFGHLSELPMQRWDESRLAVKAYEMSETGNWLTPTMQWEPDMGSTKPPLNIWLQVISIKIFGVNELATRLPSAIAALFTCLLLYWFLAIKFKNPVAGVAAAMILIISKSYVDLHGIRTGDYDSLLALFTTAYIISYYLFLTQKKSKYLLATGVMIILATMTKCVQALIFLPALLIMTIAFKQVKAVIKNRNIYYSICLFILVVGGYYGLREHYNPGFLEATYRNELGGRYFVTLEEHDQPWYYYIKFMYEADSILMLLAAWGINLFVCSENKGVKSLSVYLACLITFYTFILSLSQTKLFWYLIPIYPICALLAGLAISDIYTRIKQLKIKTPVFYFLPMVTMLFFYSINYATTLNRSFKSRIDNNDPKNAMITYLHNEGHGETAIDNTVLLNEEWAQDFQWYYHKLNTKYKIYYKSIYHLNTGDKVALFKPDLKEIIELNFNTELVKKYYAVNVYKILGRKHEEFIVLNNS